MRPVSLERLNQMCVAGNSTEFKVCGFIKDRVDSMIDRVLFDDVSIL